MTLDLALAAAAAWFALRLLAAAGLLLAMSGEGLEAPGFLLLVAKPAVFATLAAVLLTLTGWSRAKTWGTLGALAALVVALGSWPAEVQTKTNALGLASLPANGDFVFDYARDANKDGYPPCRFRTNGLGYRDEEPAAAPAKGETRVLLVGDSFVWGDGIPVNEEILAYLLRGELERRAPGRFRVMSAAYPGLGLYGYGRFIDELAARYRPGVVVAGYLGESDHDPYDAQYLLDHLPRRRFARNLLLNLGAAQHLHEASAAHFPQIWGSSGNRERFARTLAELPRKARAGGYRLMFLSYFPHPDLPEGIEALDVPEALRYPGRASDLWYAKDFHPKTKLNRMLAKMLAETLVRKGT